MLVPRLISFSINLLESTRVNDKEGEREKSEEDERAKNSIAISIISVVDSEGCWKKNLASDEKVAKIKKIDSSDWSKPKLNVRLQDSSNERFARPTDLLLIERWYDK